MHIIQKRQGVKPLLRRLIRAHNLAVILLNDVQCSFSWHLAGGKLYYTQRYDELVDAHKWCFIVGCNNSGTSLLHKILENSNAVSTLPYEGQMYTRVLMRARKRGFARVWTEYEEELALSASDHTKNVARLLHDWLRDLPAPVREIVVEKTPANVLRMTWLQKVFPGSCFIGVVRNGYAVSEGIRRKGKKDIARAARHWNRVNSIMAEQSEDINDFLWMRYEELTENTDHEMDRLAGFLGLDPKTLKRPARGNFNFKTIAGEGTTAIRNFNAESLAALSPNDISEIRANASEMLRYFGYEPY